MMNVVSFGGISLAEYKQLTGPRPRWATRLSRVGGVIALCASLTAAGDYVGLWTGKHSKSLSVVDAYRMLDSAPAEQWKKEHAMGAAFDAAQTAVGRFGQVAMDPASTTYASAYLRNIAMRCIQELRAIETNMPASEKPAKYLRDLHEAAVGR